MTDDIRSMIRRERCRQAGRTALILWIVGLLGTLAGLNFAHLGAPYGEWLAILSGAVTGIAFANILALYGWRPAQWLMDRLGGSPGGDPSIWNEPWYDDVSPFGELLPPTLLIEQRGES